MDKGLCEIIQKYLQISCNDSNINLKEISNWDSLTHIQLLTEIEEFLGLSFDFEEIDAIQSINDIFVLIDSKKS